MMVNDGQFILFNENYVSVLYFFSIILVILGTRFISVSDA